MALLKLSRVLKAVYDGLLSLMTNGWMSGSYTGAVLTEEYHAVNAALETDSALQVRMSNRLTLLD
ncbi:hypothetical protein [Methylophaga sp.]|uniref:hypothetical protein n=1 Tax=Methylophaga sp. TaxID=2024840 RepID=UPI0013FE6768|nr:hypothetical protein [Methylophaga sp.]MTI62411.1 hypothetical protein [Methylophaga sp.]